MELWSKVAWGVLKGVVLGLAIQVAVPLVQMYLFRPQLEGTAHQKLPVDALLSDGGVERIAGELDGIRQHYKALKKFTASLSNKNISDVRPELNRGDDYSSRIIEEAKDIVERMEGDPDNMAKLLAEPSVGYEKTRRKIESGLTDLWFYLRPRLNRLQNAVENESMKNKIHQLREDIDDRIGTIATDVHNLGRTDGHANWRDREAKELSATVQRRLTYLQNPQDCKTARKLVCNLNTTCGFGCQAHHVQYCLIFAYATGRTLILHSKGWEYARVGWERFFLPLSKTCRDASGNTTGKWFEKETQDRHDDFQVLEIPIIQQMDPEPEFLPTAIPEDLALRLTRLHGHPFVWWAGQMMAYTQRIKSALRREMAERIREIGFESPIVGVHVRRTDKVGREAKAYDLEEYMLHVREFYLRLEREQRVPVRRVYLATDTWGLLEEARERYPEFEFVSNDFSLWAAPWARNSEESLKGAIIDIHLLARTDFLVCTFSSSFCRLAYEMMQYHQTDAAARFRSLDEPYSFYNRRDRSMSTALYDHTPRDYSREIELRPGDVVVTSGFEGKFSWDGYPTGRNVRLSKNNVGRYPSYKVEQSPRIVGMPTYPEAEKFE